MVKLFKLLYAGAECPVDFDYFCLYMKDAGFSVLSQGRHRKMGIDVIA